MESRTQKIRRASRKTPRLLFLVLCCTAVMAQEGPSEGTADAACSGAVVRANRHHDVGEGASAFAPPTRMIIEMTTGEMHLPLSTPPAESALSRWLRLETASLSSRYHRLTRTGGGGSANNNQYQATVKGGLHFDKDGRYGLEAGLFTGNSFTSGWNNSGWGTGRGRSNLLLKQLYVNVRPITGVELQYGGLYFERGQSTEVTSYDYDGYLVGERITVTRPRDLYFDEISITYGFLGDFAQPNVFARFPQIVGSNYHQFQIAKQFGKRIRGSASYAYEGGEDVFRQAVRVSAPKLKLLDAVLFEDYERHSPEPGYGFGVYGEKKLSPRISVGAGYALIDRGGLNSDRFLEGKRVYTNGHFRLSPEFVVVAGATKALETRPGLPRTRFDLAIEYDLLRTLRKTHLF